MKSENIKLHSNITKILKYLVFIALFTFSAFLVSFANISAMTIKVGNNNKDATKNAVNISVSDGKTKVKEIYVTANGETIFSVVSTKTYRGSAWYSSGHSKPSRYNIRQYTVTAYMQEELSGNFNVYSPSRTKKAKYENTYIKEYKINLYSNSSTTNSATKDSATINLRNLSSDLKKKLCSASHSYARLTIKVKVVDDSDSSYSSSNVTITVDDYCGPKISLEPSKKYVNKSSLFSINATISDDGNHLNSSEKILESDVSLSGATAGCQFSVAGSTSTKAAIIINGCTSNSGTLYIKIKENSIADTYSNYNLESSISIMVDNVEPTITYSLPTKSPTDWAKNHTVSGIKVSDSDSGVKSRHYCWSTSATKCAGNNWQPFTESNSSIEGSGYTGKYYLLIKVEDNAGNQKVVTVTTTSGEEVNFRFDNEAPKLILIANGTDTKGWSKSSALWAIVSDEHSKVSSALLYWKEGTSKGGFPSANVIDLLENNLFNWTEYISDIENGLYIQIELKDNAGNVFVENEPLYIDNVAPKVNIKTEIISEKNKQSGDLLNLEDKIKYEITITDSNFDNNIKFTNLGNDKVCREESSLEERLNDSNVKNTIVVRCTKGGKFKLEYEVVDKAGNKSINNASYGTDNQNEFEFDENGVALKDGDSEIIGTVLANGFFPSKSNAAKANLVTYEIEEVELVDVEVVSEDTPVVVNDEEVKTIEVNEDEEEYKKLDNDSIQLENSGNYILCTKTTYLDEELKRLFIINKMNKKWIVRKEFN